MIVSRTRLAAAGLAALLAVGLPVTLEGVRPAIAQAQAQEPQTGLRQEPLVVVSNSGRHHFEVEIADTSETRSTGLMFRRDIAPDAGMLFSFPDDREVAFWMRNTLIPLDLLFIDRTGRVAHIARNAVPLSEELIPSQAVVRFVLEIAGGRAAELGIAVGDSVQAATISQAAQ